MGRSRGLALGRSTKSGLIAAVLTGSVVGCAVEAPRPSLQRFLEPTETADAEELSYAEYGAGRPILFIHGFGASRYSWRHLVPALSKNHRLLLVDLKGFGSSPKPVDAGYSLYDQAQLVHRFILRHHLDDLTLVGHSMGGGVALLVALKLLQEPLMKRRANLTSLVLIDTIAYPQDLPIFVSLLRVPIIGWLGVHALREEWQVRWILTLAYQDADAITADQIDGYAAPLRAAESKHALLETARRIVPPDLDQLVVKYEAIDIPMLILWGAEDKITPIEIGRRLHAAIRSSRLLVIEGSGHIPQEEKPDQTLVAIHDFLTSLRGAAQRRRSRNRVPS